MFDRCSGSPSLLKAWGNILNFPSSITPVACEGPDFTVQRLSCTFRMHWLLLLYERSTGEQFSPKQAQTFLNEIFFCSLHQFVRLCENVLFILVLNKILHKVFLRTSWAHSRPRISVSWPGFDRVMSLVLIKTLSSVVLVRNGHRVAILLSVQFLIDFLFGFQRG